MAVKTGDLESELIEAVCDRVRDRLPASRASIAESFVRQYFHWVPASDLDGRGEDDLFGAAMAQLRLSLERSPHQTKVRVYNPEPDRDGFRSPLTVIEIVSDDMPFIVDSVTMELARQGATIDLVIHPVIRVRRDEQGQLTEVLEPDAPRDDALSESILHAEVAREPDPKRLDELTQGLERVLLEVGAAVSDWQTMRARMLERCDQVGQAAGRVPPEEVEEVQAFLRWVADDHFVFLGYREYQLLDTAAEVALQVRPGTGLGILRTPSIQPHKPLSPRAAELARAAQPLVLTKANSVAPVHRPARMDYIGIKRFTPDGRVDGEYRFLGLYTTSAYRASPRTAPIVRGKVDYVLRRAAFPPASHDAKALMEILESYPRDALFQVPAAQLFEIAMGLLGLGERPRLRLFVWRDPLERFVSCLVTIPRDRFNTENRERVGRILMEAFDGHQLDFALQLSESLLVRVHYIIRCAAAGSEDLDLRALESRLARAIRAWTGDLRDALMAKHGWERGTQLYARYEPAFPATYRSEWDAMSAVSDIARLEELEGRSSPIINLYRPAGAPEGGVRCKLYSPEAVALSDVLPTFEHMGARVIDERPYRIEPADAGAVWIYDFGLRSGDADLERVREIFQEVFLGALSGELEDDRLNGLVLGASLPGREIMVLRAVARYLRQAGIPYSDAYMERTLLAHPDVARLLVKLFLARFDPQNPKPGLAGQLGRGMEVAIDGVQSLDEDRILRSFLTVMRAMLRTNYFRQDGDGQPLPYFSFKLDPQQVPVLPKPRPRFEIFVYSPRFEGVHLRGGKVARGGIRWSDRPEDFRTEVLGLMKAQLVKNALIVPVGAKGGFVLKRPAPGSDLVQEATACYQMFLSGLLDLTDNIVNGEVIGPPQLVRYDQDDPYLVVAADKGTAAFSDIANAVAERYGFWLGDAFASGGSHGYDHKQMGITARGAWESVRRHFRELGTDIQSTDFTVVGIGDMSGDVFGNGMLRSSHIRLLAAFNHKHIFLDPDPDPQRSFAERQRLFEMGRSEWSDYDPSVVSAGGGVHERAAKSIHLSEEAKAALQIEADVLSPAELIREILRAPVDLLWNGGVGTFVKAAEESHADVGDKANDGLRAAGRELRCRVVGEGGNLGFTQRGRIEYALAGGPEGKGGRINTDAIDNVAGVNCSDHEVNIKVLLDAAVREGRLSQEQRNQLLFQMTDDVAEQVLQGSYIQTQAISLALAQAAPMIDVHRRMVRRLEQVAGLDRELEFLPSEDVFSERKAAHRGLVAPELAVVMAYCKVYLFARLLDSRLPDDEHLFADLERYFPPQLRTGYEGLMRGHTLRREIIATVVANELVDRAGTTFAFRLGDETGAPPDALARGYAVAREVFAMGSFWAGVQALDNQVRAQVQLEMLIEARRLSERSTRWLVGAVPDPIDIAAVAERYRSGVELLKDAIPEVLGESARESFGQRVAELTEAGVPAALAEQAAAMPSMHFAFDIAAISSDTGRTLQDSMVTYFRLADRLELGWLRERILELPRASRWQALARSALREDLQRLVRQLTTQVLAPPAASAPGQPSIDHWVARNEASVERLLATLADIRASRSYDTTTLPVALRELRRLIEDAEDREPDRV